MELLAIVHVVALLASLTPQQKAAVMVVTTERPGVFTGAAGIRFADQEGGLVKALAGLPPWRRARDYATVGEAWAAGRATREALRRADVDVDFAPVLDAADGP